MTAAEIFTSTSEPERQGLRAVSVCWRRPAWTSPRLQPRWLVLSLALHAGLLGGLWFAELWDRAPQRPHLALHRVVGTVVTPPVREQEQPPLPIEVEEEILVELQPTPEPELPPFLEPESVLQERTLRPATPPRQPDLTVIRRVVVPAPPPPPVTAEPPKPEPPLPPPEPPAAEGNATAPVPLADENEPPIYPKHAIRRQQEGEVVLHVVVGADGTVDGCRVARSSGYALLDLAALTAVRRWRFTGGAGELELAIEFVLTEIGAPVVASAGR